MFLYWNTGYNYNLYNHYQGYTVFIKWIVHHTKIYTAITAELHLVVVL